MKRLWGRDDDESSEEDQNFDYHLRKVNQQCYTQQVFLDEEEAPMLGKLTAEEKRAYYRSNRTSQTYLPAERKMCKLRSR